MVGHLNIRRVRARVAQASLETVSDAYWYGNFRLQKRVILGALRLRNDEWLGSSGVYASTI